jgi:hypothetical protein
MLLPGLVLPTVPMLAMWMAAVEGPQRQGVSLGILVLLTG